MKVCRVSSILSIVSLLVASALGSDWTHWRGPRQQGVAPDTGLIDSWELGGRNVIWRRDFVGRSTPVVLDGRVCASGRVGEGIDRQERVMCFDAENGNLLWERRFNVYLTTVPFERVGWANLAADSETGYVYFHGVGGLLVALDKDGKTVFERPLSQQFGRYSGFGGRTHTPVVDGDMLFLTSGMSSWGNLAVPRHRYAAFDKRNGELVWISTPGGAAADLNTYSTPVIGDINGRKVLVNGDGDGSVYALDANTGRKLWGFGLSHRGLNSSVVLANNRVYAAHSEENLDDNTMGRLVAIDATGSGDITETHEIWRHDEYPAGFSAPSLFNGRLYIIDNSANLHVLEADTGQLVWETSLGTVGKGSPVVADNKIFAPEVNGLFHIIKINDGGYEPTSRVEIHHPGGRYAEIYGSPAIAYGRIYFTTEEGIYCLGDSAKPVRKSASKPRAETRGEGAATTLRVWPGELSLRASEKVNLKARTFDRLGRPLEDVSPTWTLQGIPGEIEGSEFTAGAAETPRSGAIKATCGGLSAELRVRVFPEGGWSADLESIEVGKYPGHWIGAFNKLLVQKLENGETVLEKKRINRGIQRAYVYLGDSRMHDYSMSLDFKALSHRRRIPDMGLINSGYILSLDGNNQTVSVHSWAAARRMAQSVPFAWESETWFRMKMQVQTTDEKATIRGKVWPRDQAEPTDWTIVAEDPHPIRSGSPGIYGQSYHDIHYQNIRIETEGR